jgi:hypothetical protein
VQLLQAALSIADAVVAPAAAAALAAAGDDATAKYQLSAAYTKNTLALPQFVQAAEQATALMQQCSSGSSGSHGSGSSSNSNTAADDDASAEGLGLFGSIKKLFTAAIKRAYPQVH